MTEVDPLTTAVTAIVTVIAVYFGLTAEQTTQVIAAVIAIAGAVFAWWEARQKTTIVQAFTADTPAANTPAVVATLPERSWKMSDSTKRWLTFDATPENKASILEQITKAEADRLTHYFIRFAGGYYEIEYGLLKGSAGNPHDIGN